MWLLGCAGVARALLGLLVPEVQYFHTLYIHIIIGNKPLWAVTLPHSLPILSPNILDDIMIYLHCSLLICSIL